MDYKNTLNLPQTDFPMRANLAQREPETLARWEEMDLYRMMLERRKGRPTFVLHDGPPYANGHTHIGHALNKILKDIIVKHRSMTGHLCMYIPGWDCHGLPIEHQVDKTLGEKKETIPTAVKRRLCREYAAKFIDIQRKEFRRLGVQGDWENPYRTMTFDYEARILRELGRFVETGAVYQGTKPVYWCVTCRTALAEAEVEYADHASHSIYVKFPFVDPPEKIHPALAGKKVFFVIWTTTPWTIPSNLAVALHPDFDYAAVESGGEVYVVADGLADRFIEETGLHGARKIAVFRADGLERLRCRHPLVDRDSILVLADYVTLDTGTGLVHTAPGHGREDYETGLRYGLPVYAPLDDDGRFTKDVPFFAGKQVFEANPLVIEKLEEVGALMRQGRLTHSYPHCWRCKSPVIFRATKQWFISMDKTKLREKTLAEIRKVRWIPDWGQERIDGMIANRPDWCISRQRSWGVPIAVFQCEECGHLLHGPEDHRPRRGLLREGRGGRVVRAGRRRAAAARHDVPLLREGRPSARNPTSSTCGSTRASPTPPCARGRRTSASRWTSTSRAPTSTAAGSTPPSSPPWGRAASRPTAACSRTGSWSTARARRCTSPRGT